MNSKHSAYLNLLGGNTCAQCKRQTPFSDDLVLGPDKRSLLCVRCDMEANRKKEDLKVL